MANAQVPLTIMDVISGGTEFVDQLEAWHPFTSNLMLNEGFLQFDFPEIGISLTNTGVQQGKPAYANSVNFTNAYYSRLGLLRSTVPVP